MVGPVVSAEEFEVVYLGTRPCAEGVASFRFSRPEGYSFTPGQFFALTLTTNDGVESKFFSHADAPADAAIELTTRLSGSAFKSALVDLPRGATVTLSGPRGRLGVPEGADSIGFLTGGVGITPAHSIIRDAMQRSSGLDIALIYGNRDESCIPYGEEFRGYAEAGTLLYVETLDHPGVDWHGESGFITADLVRRHVAEPAGRPWIVAGPPPMVDAMKRVVADLGLPSESVSYELFAGYGPNG
ncbi:MAG: FAD-dependent oxidoreductase [Actinobacteria bacterium]|nr:MAG: FAD-dependent oxidoreductase [Actinomycetota bacterium]